MSSESIKGPLDLSGGPLPIKTQYPKKYRRSADVADRLYLNLAAKKKRNPFLRRGNQMPVIAAKTSTSIFWMPFFIARPSLISTSM